jgi:hypothetical protein
MGILEDIQSALQNAWNWFTGIGASVTDALSGIGAWIYQGIVYLSNIFGQWISSGLTWIGSGVAWLGQQLYNFGQWIWNGLLWLGNAIVNAFKAVFEWIYGIATNAFNTFLSWAGGFVNFFNTWITNLIFRFRNKLKHLIAYNITMAGIEKTISSFFTEPSLKKLGGFIIAPIAGAFIAEIIDKLIPTPSTEPLQVFPWFTAPAISVTPIAIPEIPVPEAPSIGSWQNFGAGAGIQPPAYGGYITVKQLNETGNTVSVSVAGVEYSAVSSGAGNTVSISTISPYTDIEFSGSGNTANVNVIGLQTETKLSGSGNITSIAVIQPLLAYELCGAGNTVRLAETTESIATADSYTGNIVGYEYTTYDAVFTIEEIATTQQLTEYELSGAGNTAETQV